MHLVARHIILAVPQHTSSLHSFSACGGFSRCLTQGRLQGVCLCSVGTGEGGVREGSEHLGISRENECCCLQEWASWSPPCVGPHPAHAHLDCPLLQHPCHSPSSGRWLGSFLSCLSGPHHCVLMGNVKFHFFAPNSG